MTPRADDILREALALSDGDRADLATALLASLDDGTDDPAEVEAAWAAEIARRADRVIRGDLAGEAWSDVRRRIGARLQKR